MNTFVIGIGNEERGDDAAGPVVAHRLRQLLPAHVKVHALRGEPMSLAAVLQAADHVVIVDSASGGRGPAGHVWRFETAEASLPAALLRCSTHSLGLSAAIEVTRALRQPAKRLTIYCIQADSFDARGLSPEVEASVEALVRRIQAELRAGVREDAAGGESVTREAAEPPVSGVPSRPVSAALAAAPGSADSPSGPASLA
jgi:hydrogenase maturation protease